jgi:hypothetical protein
VKFLSGGNATRRKSDQYNRQQKKLLGEAWVPNSVGRKPEKFDHEHTTKRQNHADKQEGFKISDKVRDPGWQAQVQAYAQTKQGKKQMGTLAAALNTSRATVTMIKNCNDLLQGGPQVAVAFEPEELKRLYPANVVEGFDMPQCVKHLARLCVRAPENTLGAMRKTLVRIGTTGSIAGEAGVRTGGRHRSELTGKLTQGMTAQDAAKLLPEVPRKYITAAKARIDTVFVSTLGEKYASNTTKEKMSPSHVKLYVEFFKNATEFKSGSGQHTKSRILTRQRHEIIIELYAKWPKLLRQWAVANVTEKRTIDEKAPAMRSKFEEDVVAAASRKEYDNSPTEYNIRLAMAQQDYQSRLKHNATRQHKFGKVRPSSKPSITKKHVEELLKKPDAPPYLQESSPAQNPCSEEVFWKLLKDNGIKFTTTVRPTICPIHDTGPSDERALVEALLEGERLKAEYTRTIEVLEARKTQAQLESRQSEADEQALSACTLAVNLATSEMLKMSHRILDLEKKVTLYKKHIEQFETSRLKVNEIMDNLGPDECLVYRDFVNQHSWFDNTKVCNLILVVIWKEEGQLRSMKLNNFCSDEDTGSTDPLYVRDVFDFHMKPKSVQDGHTGLLSRFKKIYISGRVYA